MDDLRLIEMLREKAKKVGLGNLEIQVICEERPRLNGFMLDLEIYDGCLLLSRNGIIGLEEKDLEMFLEYQLCEKRLESQGAFVASKILPKEFTFNDYLLHEFVLAYSQYLCSKLFMNVFSQARLAEFCDLVLSASTISTLRDMGKIEDPTALTMYVLSLYKNQMKADLAGIEVPEMPKAIRLITKPFSRIFGVIHSSGIEWEQKEAVLFALGLEHKERVDIPRSYLSEKLLIIPRQGCEISQLNAFEECFSPQVYDLVLRVFKVMKEEYQKIGISRLQYTPLLIN